MKFIKTQLKYSYLKIFSIILALLFISVYNGHNEMNNPIIQYIPPNGFVPDDVTAIKIAEAIWLPIFGIDIYDKKPFRAYLKDSTVWVVRGTLKQGHIGGTPYIEIQKKDCKVLKVEHGK